ncbi:MAG TPA: carbohydrate-binding protein, partial [Gammaproteobacteria bacterium]|nr:carbohydrate-binding protein [Gammaproteobacteria bacterium]
MRKEIIGSGEHAHPSSEGDWLDLEELARVEVSSEEPDRPIENALLPGRGLGWRAAAPGPQTVRLLFDTPQRIRRIQLEFAEPEAARTQEFFLGWATGPGQEPREIVRQQWNFD